MKRRPDQLYQLLPAYYRQRDLEQGLPLKALFDVLELELAVLEQDLASLYDDWFIETCQRRLIPYIGDLVGVRSDVLRHPPRRTQVANAIATRRRKGTRGALEAAIRDATGWAAWIAEHPPQRVVEISEEIDLVVRPYEVEIEAAILARTWVRTPFGSRIAEDEHALTGSDRGGVSIYLWRDRPMPLEWTTALDLGGGRFAVDPGGLDRPLFNRPSPPLEHTSPASAGDLPVRLTRAALERQLVLAWEGSPHQRGSLAHDPALQIAVPPAHGASAWREIPASRIHACDLSDWRTPGGTDAEWEVAVDPQLGRMLFRHRPAEAAVCWCGVWPSLLERRGARLPGESKIYPVRRSWRGPYHRSEAFDSVSAAIAAWQRDGGAGVIRILDSATYAAPDQEVRIPAGGPLTICADAREMPCLSGIWRFRAARNSGPVQLQGLRIDGRLETLGPVLLTIDGCVVAPASGRRREGRSHHGEYGHPSLRATESDEGAEFNLRHSVCGPVEVTGDGGRFSADTCILDGAGGHVLRAPVVRLVRCTVLGAVEVDVLEEAVDLIVTRRVSASTARGEVRFCALPNGCQGPAARDCCEAGAEDDMEGWFVSVHVADPGYARLRPDAPLGVQTGAHDGGEMGGYHDLADRARWRQIEAVLDEYLPFGLAADVFLVT